MQRKIIFTLLALTIVFSSIGFAYSQNDTIPSWIKGVAGFWVEDKITDKEFIEALEFLVESNIIKVSDPRVLELEKEISELRQKIESFESEKIESKSTQKQNIPDKEYYITTDRTSYGLGDTIIVNGLLELKTSKKIDGTYDPITAVSFNVAYLDGTTSEMYSYDRKLQCSRDESDTFKRLPEFEFEPNIFYDFNSIKEGMPEKCNIDKNGKIELSFYIHDEYYTGRYMIESGGLGHSEIFMIR